MSPCLAVEDFEVFQVSSKVEKIAPEEHAASTDFSDLEQRLRDVGLRDFDIKSCHTDHKGKEKLVQLLERYNDVFSKHALDCGETKGFVHRIRLTDDRLFRLPYRGVPPAHYQTLRQVLTEMEEQGIIRSDLCLTIGVGMEKGRRFENLHRFLLAECENIKGCPPAPTSIRLFGCFGRKHLFQHNGFDIWLL